MPFDCRSQVSLFALLASLGDLRAPHVDQALNYKRHAYAECMSDLSHFGVASCIGGMIKDIKYIIYASKPIETVPCRVSVALKGEVVVSRTCGDLLTFLSHFQLPSLQPSWPLPSLSCFAMALTIRLLHTSHW